MQTLDSDKILNDYERKKEGYWRRVERQMAADLHQRIIRESEAYKDFIARHKGKKVSISKKNYFHKYPLSKLAWRGFFNKNSGTFTATSGSTGHPAYFMRSGLLDWQYSVLAEMFLRQAKTGPTLFINCFGLGVWIGGLITYEAFRLAGLRGYPVSIITPGINKKEIFNALRNIAPNFDCVILSGYPPFIKDVIDEAGAEGVDFKKFQVRLLMAAESFTERFRDHLVSHARIRNPLLDTLNIYGTAELGAMAFETPTAILIRRLALKNKKTYDALFRPDKLPTLAQYNPMFISFSQHQGELFLTGNSGAVPFFNYRVGDNGGVYTLSRIKKAFKLSGVSLEREAKKSRIKLCSLPFVYVYERNDFSTTLYGLQIYPQTIKTALEEKPFERILSGKFTMLTKYDQKQNQYLEINLELEPKRRPNSKLTRQVTNAVIRHLLAKNSEYRELSKMLKNERTKPKIVFWPYNHQKYFKTGVKQQWVK